MIYPITNAIVQFPNGDSFHTTNVEHLYNLHLELHEAYPRLPRGGIRLRVVEENEEEETVYFELTLDDYHLQTNVLLDELGDLAVFEISLSWWLHAGNEEWEEPYESWTIHVAIDLETLQRSQDQWIPTFYGLYDTEENVVIEWHNQLDTLLMAKDIYSIGCIQTVVEQFHACINEVVVSDE